MFLSGFNRCFSHISLQIIGFLLIFLFLAPVHGAYRSHAMSVNLGVGGLMFDGRRGLDTAAVPNLSLDYHFNSNWAVQFLAGNYHTSPRNNGDSTVRGHVFAVDSVNFLGESQWWSPYWLAGVNIVHISPNTTHSRNQAGVNAGLGLALFDGPYISLRGDVRDLYSFVGSYHDIFANLLLSVSFDL